MLAAGEYKGEIIDASMNENDGKAYALVKVKPDGSAETVAWFGSFSETVIGSGFNQGKVVGEMTAATLGTLGWDCDFTNLNTIIGKKVVFGVKHEPDQKNDGQIRAKVSYLKPVGSTKPLGAGTAKGLAARFKGAALEAKRNAPKEAPPASNSASEDFGPTEYGDTDPF